MENLPQLLSMQVFADLFASAAIAVAYSGDAGKMSARKPGYPFPKSWSRAYYLAFTNGSILHCTEGDAVISPSKSLSNATHLLKLC